MALMFAICSAQPNWMPRKPKLMFQICQKLRCGLWTPLAFAFKGGRPPAISVLRRAISGLLDEQDLPFVRPEGQRQVPGGVELPEGLLLDEVCDFAAGGGCFDGHGLANGGAPEVDGGDLSALGRRKPLDHDDQAPRLHCRDVDLLALVDAVLGA